MKARRGPARSAKEPGDQPPPGRQVSRTGGVRGVQAGWGWGRAAVVAAAVAAAGSGLVAARGWAVAPARSAATAAAAAARAAAAVGLWDGGRESVCVFKNERGGRDDAPSPPACLSLCVRRPYLSISAIREGAAVAGGVVAVHCVSGERERGEGPAPAPFPRTSASARRSRPPLPPFALPAASAPTRPAVGAPAAGPAQQARPHRPQRPAGRPPGRPRPGGLFGRAFVAT